MIRRDVIIDKEHSPAGPCIFNTSSYCGVAVQVATLKKEDSSLEIIPFELWIWNGGCVSLELEPEILVTSGRWVSLTPFFNFLSITSLWLLRYSVDGHGHMIMQVSALGHWHILELSSNNTKAVSWWKFLHFSAFETNLRHVPKLRLWLQLCLIKQNVCFW